jgi:hypothetical protein
MVVVGKIGLGARGTNVGPEYSGKTYGYQTPHFNHLLSVERWMSVWVDALRRKRQSCSIKFKKYLDVKWLIRRKIKRVHMLKIACRMIQEIESQCFERGGANHKENKYIKPRISVKDGEVYSNTRT